MSTTRYRVSGEFVVCDTPPGGEFEITEDETGWTIKRSGPCIYNTTAWLQTGLCTIVQPETTKKAT